MPSVTHPNVNPTVPTIGKNHDWDDDDDNEQMSEVTEEMKRQMLAGMKAIGITLKTSVTCTAVLPRSAAGIARGQRAIPRAPGNGPPGPPGGRGQYGVIFIAMGWRKLVGGRQPHFGVSCPNPIWRPPQPKRVAANPILEFGGPAPKKMVEKILYLKNLRPQG